MSDRQVVALMVALLGGLGGVVVLAACAFLLLAPVQRGGDLDAAFDATPLLVGGVVLGTLAALAGAAIAVGLVRRRLPVPQTREGEQRGVGAAGRRALGGRRDR
jgi:hypothetical protein